MIRTCVCGVSLYHLIEAKTTITDGLDIYPTVAEEGESTRVAVCNTTLNESQARVFSLLFTAIKVELSASRAEPERLCLAGSMLDGVHKGA